MRPRGEGGAGFIEAQHSGGTSRFRVLRPDHLALLVELAQGREGAIGYAAMGALLGLTWEGEDRPEAPHPSLLRATHDDLLDYGSAVLDEMDAAGWPIQVDVPRLWEQVVTQSAERQRARYAPFVPEVVQEQVDFSSPPPAGTSGSPPTLG